MFTIKLVYWSYRKNLINNNVLILSSGGTAKYLKDNGIKVTEVSEYTGFNEVFDGRVKLFIQKFMQEFWPEEILINKN